MDNEIVLKIDSATEEQIIDELLKLSQTKRQRIFTKFIGAALGCIPWVGGFLSAMSDFKNDETQIKNNHLYEQWLKEHANKLRDLKTTIAQIIQSLNQFPEEANERLESEEYSQIIKKSFRTWDNVDTEEKREIVRKLLTNAGAYKLVQDDLIRLFLDWVSTYHEAHFAVIRIIYKNQSSGITRYDMWTELHGEMVREDSMEADLFKLLIRDLSTGSVIRQHRPTDYSGNFIKKTTKRTRSSSNTIKSAFSDDESYVLTELGTQFVHYTMNEVVTNIGSGN
jgi:hypothetical protein